MFFIRSIEPAGSLICVKIEGNCDGILEEKRFLIAKEFFAPLGIKEGDRADDDSLDAVARAETLTRAVSKALDILSFSNVSRRTLTDKLRLKHSFPKSEAEEAADYVVRRGYLDEDAQARRIAENDVQTKNWGMRRVVSELYAKGYPKECAVEAAKSVGEDAYRAALRKLIDKKVKVAPPDAASYNKIISSLLRLGHSPSDVKEALVEKFDGEE